LVNGKSSRATRAYPVRSERKMMSDQNDEVLSGYRSSIDNIDTALVMLLAERFKITAKVGAYKAQSGMAPADSGREAEQVERLRELSTQAGLDPVFSEKFLRFIIDEVIRHHLQANGEK